MAVTEEVGGSGAAEADAVSAILVALDLPGEGTARVSTKRRRRASLILREADQWIDVVMHERRLPPERDRALSRGRELLEQSRRRLDGLG